jgi:hypothetical protein
MGGQACVLYGAAEFSRDLDLALLPDPTNLDRLQAALAELDAEVIAVPPFSLQLLTEGLAVHFRCRQPEVAGLRIDVMGHMRGVASFPELWERRTTFAFEDETLEVLALPDLVAAKKTQRDKDWPMIRRLVDVNYLSHRDEPAPERILFWLRELRSPELLAEAARSHAEVLEKVVGERPLLKLATSENLANGVLERALRVRRMRNGAGTWPIGSHCESNSSAFAGKLGGHRPLGLRASQRIGGELVSGEFWRA